MKTIALLKSDQVIVSDEDYEWASQYKWSLYKSRGEFHVTGAHSPHNPPHIAYKKLRRLIVQEITGMPRTSLLPLSIIVKYKNGDVLDNRRENLEWFAAGGERSANWKGNKGRWTNSNGYKTMNIRGVKVLEHRVVAETKIGRKLRNREVVHHINGDRADNRPENLDVLPDMAHHALLHRKDHSRRRPNEPNPLVFCACGCGQSFKKFTEKGRSRRFVSGHNLTPRNTTKNTEK